MRPGFLLAGQCLTPKPQTERTAAAMASHSGLFSACSEALPVETENFTPNAGHGEQAIPTLTGRTKVDAISIF